MNWSLNKHVPTIMQVMPHHHLDYADNDVAMQIVDLCPMHARTRYVWVC